MEAAPRFELGNKGFAVLCLTTWLCRHISLRLYNLGGEGGIRTHVGLHPNGFQDRPVMTASVPLQFIVKLSTICLFILSPFRLKKY